MADNGNRGSNESFRRNQRKRREPPIIDATATDVPEPGSLPETPSPVPAADSPSTPPEAGIGAADEPVLFGHTTHGASGQSEGEPHPRETEPASDASAAPADGGLTTPADETVTPAEDAALPHPTDVSTTPEEVTETSAATAMTEPTAAGESFAEDRSDAAPYTPVPPEALRRPAVPLLLGIVILALLAGIAGLLYTEPLRTGSAALSTEVGKLKDQVAALEARPQPAQEGPQISALDGKTASLAGEIAALKTAVASLGGRVGSAVDQSQGNAGRIAALEQKVGEAPASPPAAPASGASSPPSAEPNAAAQPAAAASASDLSALTAKVDGLDKRVAALPAGTPAAAATPETAGPTALDTKLGDLAGRVDALQANVTSIPKVDLAPLQARLDDVDHRLTEADHRGAAVGAALAALPKVDIAPLQAATAGLDKRVAGLETILSAPKAGDRVTEARAVGDSDTARAAPLAVVAQAVARALEEGKPFGAEMDALKSLGVDDAALAPLSPLAAKGAPTLDTLKAQWTGVEPDVLKAAQPKGDTVLDRFAAGARGLVQIRPVGAAATGDDPASLTARIDAALDRGDLADALAEWAKLPEAGRAASQAWADTARARLDAGAAAQALVSRAITMLGKAGG